MRRDRAAPGDAGHRAADRQRDDRHGQGHLAARRRSRSSPSCSTRPTAIGARTLPDRARRSSPPRSWYLIVCSILMVGQYFLERHYGRGFGTPPKRPARLGQDRRPDRRRTRADEHAPPDRPTAAPRPRRQRHQGFHGTRCSRASTWTCSRGEVVVPARPVRLGQDDLPALHQPARDHRRRPDLGRRRPDGLRRPRRPPAPPHRQGRSPPSAARSAWCSSGSTCSRT